VTEVNFFEEISEETLRNLQITRKEDPNFLQFAWKGQQNRFAFSTP
jgi:hypothetical protein